MAVMNKNRAIAILNDYYDGLTLKQCYEKHGVSRSSFYKYCHENPLFEESLARARQSLIHEEIEEAKEIADTEEDAAKARNRIDIRKFRASKLLASVYGDQLNLNINGQIDIAAALAEGKRRVLPVSDQSNISDAELVETKQIVSTNPTDSKSDVLSPEIGDAVRNLPDDIFK